MTTAKVTVGAPAQPHKVTLTWDEATVGSTFNVYRAEASGMEVYTSPLVSGLTVPTYEDVAVTEGATYFYTVTAMVGGIESDPSAEVSATIPTKPMPPSNLVAKAI